MVRLIETKHDIFVMYECNKYQRCFYLDVTCKNIAFIICPYCRKEINQTEESH